MYILSLMFIWVPKGPKNIKPSVAKFSLDLMADFAPSQNGRFREKIEISEIMANATFYTKFGPLNSILMLFQ